MKGSSTARYAIWKRNKCDGLTNERGKSFRDVGCPIMRGRRDANTEAGTRSALNDIARAGGNSPSPDSRLAEYAIAEMSRSAVERWE